MKPSPLQTIAVEFPFECVGVDILEMTKTVQDIIKVSNSIVTYMFRTTYIIWQGKTSHVYGHRSAKMPQQAENLFGVLA